MSVTRADNCDDEAIEEGWCWYKVLINPALIDKATLDIICNYSNAMLRNFH